MYALHHQSNIEGLSSSIESLNLHKQTIPHTQQPKEKTIKAKGDRVVITNSLGGYMYKGS